MKYKLYFLIITVVLLSIPSVWYFFLKGFPVTDDGNWMIIRFSAFYQALADGQFPVRFLTRLNFGYGYPVPNFLYPGFMYLAIPIKVVGATFVDSIKIIFGISVVFSALFMFLWLRKVFDDISASFASLFYVYLPYHLFDIVKRGSAGEALALAVLPFVLWQIEERGIVLLSIGIALLIVSHNTLAVLFLFLIAAYIGVSILILKKRKSLMIRYLTSGALGFALSAFYTLPILFELSDTVFSKTQVSDYSKYFADINLIGITTLLVFGSSLIFLLLKHDLLKKHRLTVLLLILGIISAFLASPASITVWKILPVSFIQFPFRLLSLTIISGAFVFAFLLAQMPTKWRVAVGLIVVSITIFLSKDYLIPQALTIQDDSFYSTNEATTTVADEYMPIWVSNKPVSHFKNKVSIVKGEGIVKNVFYNEHKIFFDYLSNTPSTVRISTIYYPGWIARSNVSEKAIFYDNDQGLMDLKLNPSDRQISLEFGETPIRLLADAISFLAGIILLGMAIKEKLKKI